MNLEETFDFTNWRNHPTQKSYLVFFFKTKEESNYFENLLIEHQIWFEKDIHISDKNQKKFLFGIRKDDLNQVKNLNNLTSARFRQKFISSPPLRWIVFTIAFIVLGLAILGAIVSK